LDRAANMPPRSRDRPGYRGAQRQRPKQVPHDPARGTSHRYRLNGL
jgi:hypothetical protein